MRVSVVSLLAVVWWTSASYGAIQVRPDRQASVDQGSKVLSFRDLFLAPRQELTPRLREIKWEHSDQLGDGYHSTVNQKGELVLEHIATGQQRVLLDSAQSTQQGIPLNSDKSLALQSRNVTKVYRYSTTANYFIQDVMTKKERPLLPDQNGDVQLALWNPRKPNNLVFVRKNNIYFWDNGTVSPVTTDGSDTKFNGIADWVYEEEVIASKSVWFSPDGKYLAYLSFDDSHVPVYTVPYYFADKKVPQPYPKESKIRYPKPGFPNPVVSASLVRVDYPGRIQKIPVEHAFPQDDLVIGEVAWVSGTSERLIVRCFNRVQNHDKHLLYDLATKTVQVIRERQVSDGWIENTKAMKYVGLLAAESEKEYYLDLSDMDGWMHIYLFPVEGGYAKQLTKGKWEVRAITALNGSRGVIHFTSTEAHPTESTLSSVNIFTGEQKLLVSMNEAAYWTASFSPDANYFVLNYEGPNVPYQEVYAINQTDKPIRILEDNARVMKNLEAFQQSTSKFLDLTHPSGYNLSAKLDFPPKFDDKKKYPVLLTPYGGPNSQDVRKSYSPLGAKAFITTNPDLQYVTLTVDNRGTGFRGRAFRNFFYKGMGTVDAQDQIWAAEWLAKTYPWVDADRIGIWGWSHGGYVSAKVVEYDSKIISFAIATAPTWDMRLYDSIFTERYLGLPATNAKVYDQAAINNATGFKNLPGGILIQHGTGDDNVHWSHTAALADMLISAGVPPARLQVQLFPDSEHNIQFHQHQKFLFASIAEMLLKQKERVIKPKKRYAWEEFETQLENPLEGIDANTFDNRTGGSEQYDYMSGSQMLGNAFYGKHG